MVLSKKWLTDEIEKAKIALKNLEEGTFLHKSVLAALEKEKEKFK